MVYYHKFRLVHADGEYSYVVGCPGKLHAVFVQFCAIGAKVVQDAAAAALFTACKIEDTLKKSRDILCAAYNLKLPPSEHLSPDDTVSRKSFSAFPELCADTNATSQLFEVHSRSIIGLERLMLEASSFDFRGRHPQQLTVKLAKHYGLTSTSAVSKTAFQVALDLYRTFAPLKQTTAAMAFASLELAGRLHDEHLEEVEIGADYHKWNIGRAEVMGKYCLCRLQNFPVLTAK